MSAQKSLEINSSNTHRLPEILDPSPILTSYGTGWSHISLDSYNLPSGEMPEYCLDRYEIAINIAHYSQLEQVLEGTLQKELILLGAIVLCPIYYHQVYRWDRGNQVICLNLKSELLSLHTIELLGTDSIKLIPRFAIQDGLIHKIGLALQAELRSHDGGSLYAETMANTLAVHLLRHYSTQRHRTINCNGGLPPHKLRLVTDYINDYLERELSLNELAAIAQLSQYHFCHAFKQATGLSPHQYLIQQRVERAKQLLQQGEMTIGEVAISCGFTHQSHLHRHFKRFTGITPKIWRNLSQDCAKTIRTCKTFMERTCQR